MCNTCMLIRISGADIQIVPGFCASTAHFQRKLHLEGEFKLRPQAVSLAGGTLLRQIMYKDNQEDLYVSSCGQQLIAGTALYLGFRGLVACVCI